MEIFNIYFKSAADDICVAFLSSPEKKLVLERLLNTHEITFSDAGTGNIMVETDDYCGLVAMEKLKIDTSLANISKLLETRN